MPCVVEDIFTILLSVDVQLGLVADRSDIKSCVMIFILPNSGVSYN
jgi:hypothetical protein